ncbi:MAG: MaoC family dehydratase N-terminal domain-containing protein [Spirochaetes bacterium]|nr:MaoC family dehydratase N-terminal domain-containing protein [Spirochaetota bacterium]
MKTIQFSAYNEGQDIPELRVGPIKQIDLVRYAGASGDFNPIHNDVEAAKAAGLPGTIAHGMYIMALMGRHVNNWVPPQQVKYFGVKFKGMSLPGDTMVFTGKIKKKKEDNGEKIIMVSLTAANEKGEIKVAGDLTIKAD